MYSAGTSPASTAPAPGGNLVSSVPASACHSPSPFCFLPFCPLPPSALFPPALCSQQHKHSPRLHVGFPSMSRRPIGSQLAAEVHAGRSLVGPRGSPYVLECHWDPYLLPCLRPHSPWSGQKISYHPLSVRRSASYHGDMGRQLFAGSLRRSTHGSYLFPRLLFIDPLSSSPLIA